MGVDPVEFKVENIHSFNRYAYGNNNPYKFVDPDGRESEFVNGYMAGFYNSVSGPNSHANEIRDGSATFKAGAFIGLQLTPLAILATGEAASGVIATRGPVVTSSGSRLAIGTSLTQGEQATMREIFKGNQEVTALFPSAREAAAKVFEQTAAKSGQHQLGVAFNQARANFLRGKGSNPGADARQFAKENNIPVPGKAGVD